MIWKKGLTKQSLLGKKGFSILRGSEMFGVRTVLLGVHLLKHRTVLFSVREFHYISRRINSKLLNS